MRAGRSGCDDGVILSQFGEPYAAWLYSREHHGNSAEQLRPMSLDNAGRRRTDTFNEIRRELCKERAEAVDKGYLEGLIIESGEAELDIHRIHCRSAVTVMARALPAEKPAQE